jgi:hypothetical protein
VSFSDLYDAIFKCLQENLIGGIDSFETDGGGIGLIGPRDNDSETRPIYVLTLREAKVEVVDGD